MTFARLSPSAVVAVGKHYCFMKYFNLSISICFFLFHQVPSQLSVGVCTACLHFIEKSCHEFYRVNEENPNTIDFQVMHFQVHRVNRVNKLLYDI